MKNEKQPAQVVKKEKVKLISPHEHAGKKLSVGEEIEVNPRQKQFLIDNKKIAG